MVDMREINLKDIDLSKLPKAKIQGTQSTIYEQDDICIKILDKLYPEEKDVLHRKFLAMDGISIDNVLLPKDLIIEDGHLQGYTMENFKNSMSLSDYFYRTRYVNCQDMFSAVKKASIILRDIHKNDIICQDLSFDNILIDKEGNIKYCDIDGCSYNGYISPFISIILKTFIIDYRKEKIGMISKNMDRISFMLSFFLLTYGNDLQRLSKRKYHELSDNINTLENVREYANILVEKSRIKTEIPYIPYMDELIDDNDNYIIDRKKQLTLSQRILRKP